MSDSKKYLLLGLENPLLDISAKVDLAFLEKYGLEPNGAILAEEKHKPIYEELKKVSGVEFVAGGAAQNTCRGAQWLLPADSTVYFGCIGNDENGKKLKEAAEKDGLATRYMIDEKVPTGVCGVLLTGVHRSLCTDLLAANNYNETHLQTPENWAVVENSANFYVGGYFLTVSPKSLMILAEHTDKTNKPLALNLSAPFISQFFKDPLDAAIPYTDIIFGNESEAEAFADSHNFGTKDVKEIALKIAALEKRNGRERTVVITQGVNPTIVATVSSGVKEYPVVKIPNEQIVDTNGAGDAFCAGYMSQFVQGKDIDTCVKAGHYVAHIVIQRSGPTYPSTAPEFTA